MRIKQIRLEVRPLMGLLECKFEESHRTIVEFGCQAWVYGPQDVAIEGLRGTEPKLLGTRLAVERKVNLRNCSGITFRFLPMFFKQFYPLYGLSTLPEVLALIDVLARHKIADNYDSQTGVIRAHPQRYRLQSDVADITLERLRDPHIAYFAQRNSGHARVD